LSPLTQQQQQPIDSNVIYTWQNLTLRKLMQLHITNNLKREMNEEHKLTKMDDKEN